MRKCAIIAGGAKPEGDLPLKFLAQADYLICADSGANHAYDLGYVPDLIVGDFDSVDKAVLEAYSAKGCPVETYPVEKDYTDTELALQLALAHQPEEIYLFAATGDRLDHTLANVLLLIPFTLQNPGIKMIGNNFAAWVCRGNTVVHGKPGDLVSTIPLSSTVTGITLRGFKYPLENDELFLGSSRGISNELSGDCGQISLREGLLLVVHTVNVT